MSSTRVKKSILIINPNSTASMTATFEPLVTALGFSETDHVFFTAPSGPQSINNDSDAASSAEHCLPHLLPLLDRHDGFLVACYSAHPLVPVLKAQPQIQNARKCVTGIFEASVATSLQLLAPTESFGVVSTGKVWKALLHAAVVAFLGGARSEAGRRFAGVQTTGLDASQLHNALAEEVRRRMKEATKRLLRSGDVGSVCLGCAGMAGMGEMVREACVEELGKERGERVKVVDGVQAGVAWLEGAVRSEF
ncbi:hypothetical protein B0A49_06936 [Cryomyces minteri]|uniref:Asp/Glu/hydantoin racemase n=1 Tax=Cryomyces minteri TaxID=331657 RepID=A0A4U0X4W1_9PEZI|nr:hypothetical protein B0A49_10288 [Cryomyces minteri]TKA70376.1 hypothetical protein B0A49_06936 [Cryomyces minteri]